MTQDVLVVGVGMVPFTKPGSHEPCPQMAAKSAHAVQAVAGERRVRIEVSSTNQYGQTEIEGEALVAQP